MPVDAVLAESCGFTLGHHSPQKIPYWQIALHDFHVSTGGGTVCADLTRAWLAVSENIPLATNSTVFDTKNVP
jgi:hypothetical protein